MMVTMKTKRRRRCGVAVTLFCTLTACTPAAPTPSPTPTTEARYEFQPFLKAWPPSGSVQRIIWAGTKIVLAADGDVYSVQPEAPDQPALLMSTDNAVLDLVSDEAGALIGVNTSGSITVLAADGSTVRRRTIGLAEVSGLFMDSDGTRLAEFGDSLAVTDARSGRSVARGELPGDEWPRYFWEAGSPTRLMGFPGHPPGRENSIDVWTVTDNRLSVERQFCGCDPIRARFNASGSRIALAGDDGLVTLWDTARGAAVASQRVARPAHDRVEPLAVLGDATVLYQSSRSAASGTTAYDDLMRWHVGTGKVDSVWGCGPRCFVSTIAVSPDGRRMVVLGGSPSGTSLWLATPVS
ncbi:WD40 repeat domain-containing protein [Jidongwangia harbinensis]|uniref:WD40 repeat domain-containing protein n=1 Tax=Jidongwangia harbinensis TaxID=2878561 RepID=UPI001CD95E7C|nr:WD40 repeat domain-containing protein [Jidongwangia harbinensis]MCA2215701.1 WD40 repeat domain-containing protein [Jidongwangia harbinensis]